MSQSFWIILRVTLTNFKSKQPVKYKIKFSMYICVINDYNLFTI